MKNTLKILGITIFLSVISMIGIKNVNAAPSFEPNYQSLFYSLDNFPYNSYYHIASVMLLYDTNTETYYAIGSHQSYPNVGTYLQLTPVGNKYLSYYSNFYGFGSWIYNADINLSGYTTPVWGLYYDKVNEQWTDCNGCWGRISNTYYTYAFLPVYYSGITPLKWVERDNENNVLFNEFYNLDFYSSILDYWDTTGNYTYIDSPTNVYASHTGFVSDELQILDMSDVVSYLNNNVYQATETSDEYRMYGARFNYDFQSANNYELGFILTYKSIYTTDTNDVNIPTLVVLAKTKSGTYRCNPVSVRIDTDTDISYQSYVNCPSIALTDDDDDFIDIIVQGENDTTTKTNLERYEKNALFTSDISLFGISSLLKRVTSTTPVPVEPSGDDDSSTIIDSMTNSQVDDFSSVYNGFTGFLYTNNAVSDLLLLPVTLLSSINSTINGTCSPFTIPVNNNYTLSMPCINVESLLGHDIWVLIDLAMCGYFILVIRKRIVNIYHNLSGLEDRGNEIE